jgi:hypothetical protein
MSARPWQISGGVARSSQQVRVPAQQIREPLVARGRAPLTGQTRGLVASSILMRSLPSGR